MKESMKVGRGDMVRLAFSSKDIIADTTAYLLGHELTEGQVVTITIHARVTRTPSGNLIFGEFTGDARHE